MTCRGISRATKQAARTLSFIVLTVLAGGAAAQSETTNTDKIMTAMVDLQCLDYEVVGGCLWLSCSITGCKILHSVKIRHRMPELVVSSYPHRGRGPFPESQWIPGSGQPFSQDGGSSTEGGSTDREQALRFRVVDVLGSPATAPFQSDSITSGPLPFCQASTRPFAPHFVSAFDPNWRDPLVETPWTLANLFEGIRKGGSFFGGLYPRIGFVNQNHDYKASLVAAKRGAHIVRVGGPHVRVPIRGRGGAGQWPAGSGIDFVWQQLVPKVQSCRRLPDIDDTGMITDPYKRRLNQTRGNAWQLWRPYECCQQRGSFISDY